MLKVEEKVTFIWQNIHPEKFDPYTGHVKVMLWFGCIGTWHCAVILFLQPDVRNDLSNFNK